MNITADMKVSDIALADTRLREALETMGIDTCCGGQKPLRDAALAIAHPVENVVQELHKALERPLPLRAPQKDWRAVLPCELCRHIVDTHHAYLYSTLPHLQELLDKVRKAHAERHGAMLTEVARSFEPLRQELLGHLPKEENILFPLICALEQQTAGGPPARSHCGSVRNPIGQMIYEHEGAGRLLEALRKTTQNYAVLPDFCTSFRALYDGLQQLEADLHEHIFLENNILFPKAISLEEQVRTT